MPRDRGGAPCWRRLAGRVMATPSVRRGGEIDDLVGLRLELGALVVGGLFVEVLEVLEGGRKILMTPGMVELGEIQAAENRQVALKAASICDLAIVVGDTNKEALKAGLLEGGLSADKLMEFPNRDLALAYLTSKEHRQAKDLILIENDLPDLYEAISRF